MAFVKMAKVLRVLKTLRNHWKKSTFAFLAISYGVKYVKDRNDTFELMRSYCEEAAKYGELPLPIGAKPRHITVILNPAANRRKAVDLFDKYCAPIFHLAGISVSIVKTENAGQTKGYMEVIDDTQAVVLAGGDGTLSEAVTGMLRREDADRIAEILPIGILPIGRTNSVAKAFYCRDKNVNSKEAMMKASMAVVKEVIRPVDVMKINVMEEDGEVIGKPVFSPGRLDWGAFHDTYARRDKYWFWGSLRSYASYVFSSYKDITWECDGELRYVLPCSGCSKCKGIPRGSTENITSKDSKGKDTRWWQSFIPRKPKTIPAVDYSAVSNPDCGKWHSKSCSTVDFSVVTRNVGGDSKVAAPHFEVKIGPQKIGMLDFITEGWNKENDKESLPVESFCASELEIKPSPKHKEPEQWLYIDKENFDVRPIHIALIPNKVKMFCAS